MVLLNDTRLIPEVVTGSERDRSHVQGVSHREIPFLIVIACSKAGPDTKSEILYPECELRRVGTVISGLVDAIVNFPACPSGRQGGAPPTNILLNSRLLE